MHASALQAADRRTRPSPRVRRLAGLITVLVLACAPLAVAARDAPPVQINERFGSHEFADTAELARWTSFEAQHGWPDHLRRAQVVDGVLEIEPWTSGWYADFHAPFLHREVTGNFFISTRIAANGRAGEVPQSPWSLAGLMVREPRAVTPADWEPRAENWLFITTGVAHRPGVPVFESKTTVNSRSNLKLRPAPAGWVELGVARIGPNFFLLVRAGDGSWRVHERFYRSDLPRTVQVGLVAYTDWDSAVAMHDDPRRFNTTVLTDGKPDLVARVDWVRHKPLPMPQGVDLGSLTDSSVSDARLLELIAP